jgi:replicative DNA helicase
VNEGQAPFDGASEEEVLGCCMAAPKLITDLGLTEEYFYEPANAKIWAVIARLLAAGQPVSLAAVYRDLQESGQLGEVGGGARLHTLVNMATPLPESVSWHVDRLKDQLARRRLVQAHQRGLQEALTSDVPVQELAARAEVAIGNAVPTGDDADDLLTLDEFTDQALPDEEWIIPKLLARGDRVVLTGLEGLGKSVLSRQFAVCAAAGMDPFSGRPTAPRNVLVVDCENPVRIMVNSYRMLKQAVASHGFAAGNRLWIKRRPEGIDLALPKERLWLQRLCRATNPDLLVIGPAYKMHTGGGEREEDLARQVTHALDVLREEIGFALLLEHHAPHAAPGAKSRSVRPFGSSLWMRWPEFGIGIRYAETPDAVANRVVDVVHWRGGREDRPWPERLESGGDGMPWVEAYNWRVAGDD